MVVRRALFLIFLLEWVERQNTIIVSSLIQLVKLILFKHVNSGLNDVLKLDFNGFLNLFCHLPIVAVFQDGHPFRLPYEQAVSVLSTFVDKMGPLFKCHPVRPNDRIFEGKSEDLLPVDGVPYMDLRYAEQNLVDLVQLLQDQIVFLVLDRLQPKDNVNHELSVVDVFPSVPGVLILRHKLYIEKSFEVVQELEVSKFTDQSIFVLFVELSHYPLGFV
jgi:hypothetical protein